MSSAVSESSLFWETHRGTVFETDELEDLIAVLLANGGSSLVYRGQSNFEWGLTCSLTRALREQAQAGGPIPLGLYDSMVTDQGKTEHARRMELRMEQAFVDLSTRAGAAGLPTMEDRLAWWEIMQHYGVPTRLLDWTRSPFVAMWFASENLKSGDASLWIYDTQISSVNYQDSIRKLDQQETWEIENPRSWLNELARLAIEKASYVPLVVPAQHGVARITAQQGVLTLIPNVTLPTGFHEHVFETLAVKIRIRAAWRRQLQRVMDSMGLNRFSLFRDLDSLGSAISNALRSNAARPIP